MSAEEVTVPTEYSDFAEVFSKDSPAKLPEHTGINGHAVDLEDGKQSPYRPISSLAPVELETLKTYIDLKRVEIEEATASKLMENLLQIFDRVTACVRQKTDFRCLADISSPSLHLLLPELSP